MVVPLKLKACVTTSIGNHGTLLTILIFVCCNLGEYMLVLCSHVFFLLFIHFLYMHILIMPRVLWAEFWAVLHIFPCAMPTGFAGLHSQAHQSRRQM